MRSILPTMKGLMLISSLALGVLCIFSFLLNWNYIRYSRKGLPPGTMRWPFFGETLKFLELGPEFMKRQRARLALQPHIANSLVNCCTSRFIYEPYGNLFKTHILGCPTVICMDPELNRYILLNEAKGFASGYPQSLLDILGEHNIASLSGFTHKQIRGAFMLLMGPSTVKEQLLPKIDKYMRLFLQNWHGKTIDIQEKIQEMAFFLFFNQLFGDQPCVIYEALKAEFDKLLLGIFSLPINLPGTNYYKGLQARKNIVKLLTDVVKNRRASSSIFYHDDMLNSLLANKESNYKLNDEEIYDQIITILHTGYETISATSMMAVKYLHDHPKALEEIRDEHFMVQQNKSHEQPIDWNDYKSMRFTRAVIFETIRLATVVNGVLRKATKDMKLNGFLIPKGWKIYAFIREINYDPHLYPEPFKFNPWRWLQDTSLESHSYFFLFGGGSRLCLGKELGMVTISVFLHYFLTWYRSEEIGEKKIQYFPRVEAPEGLHMRVTKYQ